MKKSDIFLNAMRSLKNRKTRTRLTVIGVVIGACSILIMVSIGVGIDKMVTKQYADESSLQKITVFNPNEDEYGDETAKGDSSEKKKLPFDDSAVEYFQSIDHVKMVVPTLSLDSYVIINRGKYAFSSSVIAADTKGLQAMGYALTEGSFDKSGKNVMFFGPNTVTDFSDAQGKNPSFKFDKDGKLAQSEINLSKDTFTIRPKSGAEVSDSTGQSAQSEASETAQSAGVAPQRVTFGGILKVDNTIDYNIPDAVFIDMDSGKKLIEQYNVINNKRADASSYSQMSIIVDDMANMASVKKTLQDNGFSAQSDDDSMQEAKQIMKIVQLVMGALGAISMFVAAVGISNTMVMSVYERTKEIGIMKVLGCELKDIKAMFLYEAGCIGLIGGVIGLIISYIVSILANAVVRNLMASQSSPDTYICVSSIPLWLAVGGIVFSVLVGIIAGLAPASKAVSTSALSAIHNE